MFSRLLQYLDIRYSRSQHRAPASLPILLLWVTDRCNLRCRMCGDQWRIDLQQVRPLLTVAEIDRIIAAARRLNTMVISLTGGEPLLHPQIIEILTLIARAGISANLCTNGTLLTDELVAQLAETSLKSISISIDSPHPEEHDRIRGREGAFQAAIAGIRRLRQAMPALPVNINCTVTRKNFRDLEAMVRLAAELGCAKISFAPVHTNLQHKDKPKELFEGMIFAPEELAELSQELKQVVALAISHGIRTSSRPFLRGIPRLYSAQLPRQTCYAGYASCSISPWGDVAPCVDMASSLNIRDLPLDEIWRSAAFQTLREQVDRCATPCWDTTNAEIAIRFSTAGLFGALGSIWRDLRTYAGSNK
ncbi:MAG: radical SAM protein [Desulfobulbaceae bacterium]|nr:radical SAM protein [Desulfobulbaceae bacterium]